MRASGSLSLVHFIYTPHLLNGRAASISPCAYSRGFARALAAGRAGLYTSSGLDEIFIR